MRSLFRPGFKWPVLPVICVALAALAPAVASADTISRFNVSGALMPSGKLTGTLMIDVTAGTVTNVSVTFPTLATFDVLTESATFFGGWAINATNTASDLLFLSFTTTPTAGSLVGFAGGSITTGEALSPSSQVLFTITSGTGSIAPVPEPRPLVLFLVAGLAFLAFGLGRRRMLRGQAR
ncbi:MAG TPA: hypothetical protein VMI06_06380 [Terriglobia bacterium]|nr:hypothetical protein [Terriglobia bacterium]